VTFSSELRFVSALGSRSLSQLVHLMATGMVKWFNATNGFGFIQSDDGGPDAFVHIGAVEWDGFSDLPDGQRLFYEVAADQRRGKSSAEELQLR
jgi:CspA family cold shock protein